MIDRGRRLIAWRIVYGGLITALYARVIEYTTTGISAMGNPIVAHPLVPELFLSGKLALVAYGLPLLGVCFFLSRHYIVVRSVSILTLGCSVFLLLGTCFGTDATFVSATWVSAWLVWFSFRMGDPDGGFAKKAVLFGKGIVGLCFFGGAVGKLTGEYWDGGAFYKLFFEGSDYWFFATLRNFSDTDTLQAVALWFSRLVIVTELILGTLILWPVRWALIAVSAVVVGMVITFHPAIYSAVGSLVWLLAGCYFLTSDLSKT